MQKVSKEFLEILNSISWLLMDAMWMLNEVGYSYIFIIPTVLSAFWLLFKEDQLDGLLVALAALMWCMMNSIWLTGETLNIPNYLIVCKVCFVLGLGSLITGLILSKDIAKTMSAFKRFKVKQVVNQQQKMVKQIIK